MFREPCRLGAAFFLILATPLAAAPRIIAAAGSWAALSEARSCEAAARAQRVAAKGQAQARASVAFDAEGPRHGEFAARLSRVIRPGSSVMLTIGDAPFLLVARGDMAWSRGPAQEAAIIAALRGAGWMRVEARSTGGARFVDRYALDGAPTAIDAAAACAATMPPTR